MSDNNTVRNFEVDYRDNAIALVDSGSITAENMIIALVKYMSMDDVFDCLKCNDFLQDIYVDNAVILESVKREYIRDKRFSDLDDYYPT
jgi:hypothetical protein